MWFKAMAMALAIGTLAACAGEDPVANAEKMALACQTATCACVAENQSMLRKDKTTDVLWKANGDAHCPKGFALEKVIKK
mgnify:CR=1 FL=1|jgi:hypothetical protein